MTDRPPPVRIEPATSSFWNRFSIVWIIPLLALLIALGVAWQSFSSRGPLIEISFKNGAGVAAGQTELRYRDVTVGTVETVKFSDDLASVMVGVRLDKKIAPFVDSGSKFWVVRPQVTTQGISGLDTVLSGVFIEGAWDSDIGEAATTFRGLNNVPLIRPSQPGLQIALRSTANTALTDNAPILYRGIEVGRIGRAQIVPNGSYAIAEAIIYEDHRHLVTETTRFWDISGFDFSISASGAEVDFQSIASLLSGGLTFETIVSGGEVVRDGQLFNVYEDETTARASVFNASDVETLDLSVIFADNVAGLVTGAAVELSGLKIGEVTALSGIIDEVAEGDRQVRLNATVSIQPARLGLEGEATPDRALAFLQERAATGLRARLASASILTGGLKVELVSVEDAPFAQIDMTGDPFPLFPTTKSEVSDVAATAEGVFNRINNLPIEDLLGSAIDFLNSANALVSDEALRETPQDVQALIAELRGLVGSPQAQQVPEQLNAALARIDSLLAEVEKQGSVTKLNATLEAATAAATGVDKAIVGVPDLIARLDALAAKAEALEVEALVKSATAAVSASEAMLGDVSSLVGSPEAQQLPAQMSAAITRLDTLLAELETQKSVAKLNSALEAAAAAASGVDTAIAGVPALIERLDSVAAKANALEVETLVTSANEVMKAAETLIASEETAQLPASLASALDEIRAALKELREGGAIENTNTALASASRAADALAASTQDLPALVVRMNRVLGQASATLQSYDANSDVNRGARDALRDIQKAADAIANLARTIQRNPNSLLLGR